MSTIGERFSEFAAIVRRPGNIGSEVKNREEIPDSRIWRKYFWKIGGVVLLEMDSVAVTVPLRQPTKKMKKRKELDALAPAHAISRRSSGKRSSQVII